MLIFFGFDKLKTGVLHVHFTSLNVVWPENSHAAAQRGLVEISGVLILLIEDEQLSHDTVDVYMQWMVRPPVMIQDF